MSIPIRKLDKREMYLHEDWATVEVEGKTYTFQRAIPGGAILIRAPDGTDWIVSAQDIAKACIEAIEQHNVQSPSARTDS